MCQFKRISFEVGQYSLTIFSFILLQDRFDLCTKTKCSKRSFYQYRRYQENENADIFNRFTHELTPIRVCTECGVIHLADESPVKLEPIDIVQLHSFVVYIACMYHVPQ